MTGRAKSGRRRALAIAAVLLALAMGQVDGPVEAQPRKPEVHVFLQLDAKSSAVEKALQEHLPALTITVFGRYRDFEEALGVHPDAILSITPVLAYRGASVTLQGMRGADKVEAYVLASADRPLEGPLAGKTIGVVDWMGREGTQAFLNKLFDGTDMKMKRASKMEDLLSLLEFSSADGVVLPAAALARLTERTRLAIKTRELPAGSVGLPAVAVQNAALRGLIVKSFQDLDDATNRLLGVDSWSVP
ncbi:MAG: hypothetical protein ABSC94_27090 [Polyangiaceae bacterium]